MFKLKVLFIYSIVLIMHAQGFAFDKLKLVYTSVGIGTWTTLNPGVKNSFLNSSKPDLYFKAGNLSWHISVPLQYSVEYLYKNRSIGRYNEIIKYSFNVVDIATDVGWRIGPVVPNIGIVFPTGYNANDYSGAWVGSGNRKIFVGLNFPIGKSEGKVKGSGNVNVSTTINGYKDGAAFESGIVKYSGSLKGTYQLNKLWDAGADVYVTHGTYGKNWEKVQPGWKEAMRTTAIVPALSVRRKLSSHTDIGIRAGYGTSFDPHDSSKEPTQIIVGSLSLAIY
jgi:hypothetical protein